jgi:hypothetical protein
MNEAEEEEVSEEVERQQSKGKTIEEIRKDQQEQQEIVEKEGEALCCIQLTMNDRTS